MVWNLVVTEKANWAISTFSCNNAWNWGWDRLRKSRRFSDRVLEIFLVSGFGFFRKISSFRVTCSIPA